MTELKTVTLEILRPGPSHNQLLSPLTPYIALCGDEGPVTLRIHFEHWKLLNRLKRLRYKYMNSGKVEPIHEDIREAEVLELGQEIGEIFANIPTLHGEIGRSSVGERCVVHLRLVLSGSELAMIPFELVTSTLGLPGEGLPLLLQNRAPVTMTREVRRGRPLRFQWDRQPRLLFVSAGPGSLGLPTELVKRHVHALWQALEPTLEVDTSETNTRDNSEDGPLEGDKNDLKDKDSDNDAIKTGRRKSLEGHLDLILNASLEDIRRKCAENHYTHIHILAHGAEYEEAYENRYGVALHRHGDKSLVDIVDGKRLSEALIPGDCDGPDIDGPVAVSLATCDSGNLGSVVTPGGSIAHDLQAYGIPWVFASQFPLTMIGSVTETEILYECLLKGADPRTLLHELRQRLHLRSRKDHDWASIVAYASIPNDFDSQLSGFRTRQTRLRIGRRVGIADRYQLLADGYEKDKDSEKAEHFRKKAVRSRKEALEQLENWSSRLPPGDTKEEQDERAECFGLLGSTEKRNAESFFSQNEIHNAKTALERAREWYEQAMQGTFQGRLSHWVATQTLSMKAVLGKPPDYATWHRNMRSARKDLEQTSIDERAWAHGSLAELELLGLYHDDDPKIEKVEKVGRAVEQHCKKIVELRGKESFHATSTCRQLKRYVKWWNASDWIEKENWKEIAQEWEEIARSAVDVLSGNNDELT